MNKLEKYDAGLQKVFEIFLGISMALLTLIVFIQVFARYVLKVSLGGLTELPQYLMIASVWFAATILTAKRKHISLDMATLVIKNKRILKIINAVMDLMAVGALCYFTYYIFDYMVQQKTYGTFSPGLRFPMWIIPLIIGSNSILMIVYSVRNLIFTWKELRNGTLD